MKVQPSYRGESSTLSELPKTAAVSEWTGRDPRNQALCAAEDGTGEVVQPSEAQRITSRSQMSNY